MDLQVLKQFLMWCTAINATMFVVSALLLAWIGDFVYSRHARMYRISREAFNVVTYSYIGVYKVFFIMFNLVPYLALVIVTR